MFEELNADLFARITERIDTLLSQHNITKAELSAIEMVGGASRVPRLQVLDRHQTNFCREQFS